MGWWTREDGEEDEVEAEVSQSGILGRARGWFGSLGRWTVFMAAYAGALAGTVLLGAWWHPVAFVGLRVLFHSDLPPLGRLSYGVSLLRRLRSDSTYMAHVARIAGLEAREADRGSAEEEFLSRVERVLQSEAERLGPGSVRAAWVEFSDANRLRDYWSACIVSGVMPGIEGAE